MKMKLQAGMDIDLLTESEVRGALADFATDWVKEMLRGVKFRKAGGQAQKAAGVFSIDGSTQTGDMGPAPGMIWSVTNVALGGGGFVQGTDLVSIFHGDNSSLNVVRSGVTRDASFPIGVLVVGPGDYLTVAGAATGAANDVAVTLLCAEVPIKLAHLLLG